MATTTSPNMSLPVPVVGVEPGPAYAQDINTCLTTLDAHNHTSGNGVQVPSSGLNINADLPFGGNNAITIRSARFNAQPAVLAVATDRRCLYAVGNELYYNDGLGNQVKITNGGAVTGSAGTISGLPSGTASAAYIAGSQTFVFQSATNIAANMDFGSIVLRNLSPNSTYGVTIAPPAALAANYSLVLPNIPASNSFVTIDTSGNLGTASSIAGTQIAAASLTGAQLSASANIAGSQLAAAAGIVGTQIASATIAGSNIAASTVANSNMVANTLTQASVSTSFINSGLYTPIRGATNSNVAGYTYRPAQWLQVGNTVTVSARVDVTLGAATAFTISWFLPIASVFTGQWQVNGMGYDEGNTFSGVIQPLTTSQVTFSSPNTLTAGATYFVHCHYTYQVI